MLAPSSPSSDAIGPSTPGRSAMVRRNETMRPSRSSSRTMMLAIMRGSILPPHRISPILRPRNPSGRARKGGGARAPPPPRNRLLQGEVGVHGALQMRFADQDDVAHERAHRRQREFADILDRNAFRKRRSADRIVRSADGIAH